jgi:hypothetical protein
VTRKAIWTEGQDTRIRRLRTEGVSWDVIALALGLARWAVIERARIIGADRRLVNGESSAADADRSALPAGHADSWGAINRGTALDGVAFRVPGSIR